MSIDFAQFERPESISAEVLQNTDLLSFINSSIDKQVAASSSSYEERLTKGRTDKAIADQKVEDLRTKLDEAVRQSTGNVDIDKLRAQLAKAKDDSAAEYKAQLDAMRGELEKSNETATGLNQKIENAEKVSFLRDSINEYNAKYPSVKTVDGGEKYLIEQGLKSWKKAEGGDFRAYDGDKPLTSGSGFMTGAEYIATLRDSSDTSIFFNQPNGSGASGGKGSGAGDKTMTRSQWAGLPPSKQAEVATTHKITDG